MGHEHSHAHHHQGGGSQRALLLALVLTLGFAAVEGIAGWWSGSLALLGDAGHMLTDSLSLALAAFAAWLAQRPPSQRHSYGLGRSETLAALFNALLMIAVVVAIAVEAADRLREPRIIDGATVTLVAFLGLMVNVAAAWLLSGRSDNLNVRAALLHVIGDLLGSIAALISGVVILSTGWSPIDPLLSLLIVALILVSALRVLREALHALMEGVPRHLNAEDIGRALARLEHVASVHDLHIWSLSAERNALSAHLVLDTIEHWDEVLPAACALLHDDFGIDHATLQPESLTQRVAVTRLFDNARPHPAAPDHPH